MKRTISPRRCVVHYLVLMKVIYYKKLYCGRPHRRPRRSVQNLLSIPSRCHQCVQTTLLPLLLPAFLPMLVPLLLHRATLPLPRVTLPLPRVTLPRRHITLLHQVPLPLRRVTLPLRRVILTLPQRTVHLRRAIRLTVRRRSFCLRHPFFRLKLPSEIAPQNTLRRRRWTYPRCLRVESSIL